MHNTLSEDDIKREVRRARIANYTIFSILLAILFAIIIGCFIYRYQHTFHSDRWLNEPIWSAIFSKTIKYWID